MPPSRLLTLTLCIEDEVRRERWRELRPLLNERSAEIKYLVESGAKIDSTLHQAIRAADQRIIEKLRAESKVVLSRLTSLQKGRQLRKAYSLSR